MYVNDNCKSGLKLGKLATLYFHKYIIFSKGIRTNFKHKPILISITLEIHYSIKSSYVVDDSNTTICSLIKTNA